MQLKLDTMIEHGQSQPEDFELFDSLAAVALEQALGQWQAIELKTGHPADGLLTAIGLYGKFFESPEIVHPLVFKNDKC